MHLDVVRELKASTEVKVLLAVDSYNEFFQPSMWHYMDDKVCAYSFSGAGRFWVRGTEVHVMAWCGARGSEYICHPPQCLLSLFSLSAEHGQH